jgi:hypothetical protein
VDREAEAGPRLLPQQLKGWQDLASSKANHRSWSQEARRFLIQSIHEAAASLHVARSALF